MCENMCLKYFSSIRKLYRLQCDFFLKIDVFLPFSRLGNDDTQYYCINIDTVLNNISFAVHDLKIYCWKISGKRLKRLLTFLNEYFIYFRDCFVFSRI